MSLELLAGGVYLVAPIGLWLLVGRLRPSARQYGRGGIRNGLLVAVLIAVGAVLFGGAYLTGREFFGSRLEPGEAIVLGGLTGIVLGFLYFWFGMSVLPLGLIAGGGRLWALVIAWVVAPVLGIGLVYGYQSTRLLALAAAEVPQLRSGTLTLELARPGLPSVSASGAVVCEVYSTGEVDISAGLDDESASPALMAADGDPVGARLNVLEPSYVHLAVRVRGEFRQSEWGVGADLTTTIDGGEVSFSGLVATGADGEPDPSDPWSGVFRWNCPA